MLSSKKYPNIDAERVRNGMSIEELANSLGVTRKTYYNWRKNGAIPRAKLEQMADHGRIILTASTVRLSESRRRL